LGFWVFSPGVPVVLLGERYPRNLTPFRVFILVQITSFLLSVREFCSMTGSKESSMFTVGSTGLLHTLEGKPSGSYRVADYHSVEQLAFQLLDRGDQTLLQASTVGSPGPLSSLGMKVFWCHPLSSRLLLSSAQWETLCSHSLMKKLGLSCGHAWWEVMAFLCLGEAGLLASTVWQITTGRDGFLLFVGAVGALGGEHWASVLCGEGNLLVPAKQQSMESGIHFSVCWWAPATE
jgi:hypothetical protein